MSVFMIFPKKLFTWLYVQLYLQAPFEEFEYETQVYDFKK